MLGKLTCTLLVAMTAFSGCLSSDDDTADALSTPDVMLPMSENFTFGGDYLLNLPETEAGQYIDFVVPEGATLLNLNATWTCAARCTLDFHLVNADGEKMGEGRGMDAVVVDIVEPLAGNWTLHVVPVRAAFMVEGVAVLTSSFDAVLEDDEEVEA